MAWGPMRVLSVVAALVCVQTSVALGGIIGPTSPQRFAVDETAYPWSSIGKLFNETGASCSGVVIAQDKILTAAHCIYNARTQKFIAPEALHFLVGYRTGRYSVHARIASYEIGPGFNPRQYNQTSSSDWAVLHVAGPLPAAIEPLRLHRGGASSGTKAILAGYPQDRAYAMSADRDCELSERVLGGRLLSHTCRSAPGLSGAPILVRAVGGELEVAAVQIASWRNDGAETMIAVPAQSIWRGWRDEVAPAELPVWVGEACLAASADNLWPTLDVVHARLDWPSEDRDTVAIAPLTVTALAN